MDRQKQCAFVIVVVAANSSHMFNANELKEGSGHPMDSSVGVWDVFATMQATPRLFKTLTDFILAKFDELTLLMTPTIVCHAHSTCEHHIQVLNLRFTLKFLF
jgi:hypothetical protein